MNRIVRTAASVLVALGLAAGLAPTPAQTATVKASGWTVSTGCTAGTRVRLKVNAPSVTAAKSALTKTQRAKQAAAGYTSANRDGKTIYLYGVAMKTTKAVKIGKVTAPARGNCVLPANVKITGKIAPTAAQREVLIRNASKLWRKDFPQWRVGFGSLDWTTFRGQSWTISDGPTGGLREHITTIGSWETGNNEFWVAAHEAGHGWLVAILGEERYKPWLVMKGFPADGAVEHASSCIAEEITGLDRVYCTKKQKEAVRWLMKAPLFDKKHPVKVPTIAPGTVKVTGTPKVGQTLTASVSGWSKNTKLSYSWYRVDPILGIDTRASGFDKTYKLTRDDAGKKIILKVSARETGKLPLTVETKPTLMVPMVENIRTVGYTVPGAKVTAVTAGWAEGTTFTYAWTRQGSTKVIGTGQVYVITEADYNSGLRVMVTVVGTRPDGTQLKLTSVPHTN